MKKAFTLLELVFVIVVIGILSVVAVPKLAPIVTTAKDTKAKDTYAAVRSSMATERQKRILKGDFTPISDLGDSTYAFSYFDGNTSLPVLEVPVPNCAGTSSTSCWSRDGSADPKTFTYRFSDGSKATFKIENSRLVCADSDTSNCDKLMR